MPVAPDERLSVSEHLGELRKRLFWCLAVLALGVVVAAVCNDFVFSVLLWPLEQVSGLPASAHRITTFSPVEPFMVSLKVWVVAGLVMASPFLVWQLWAFVGPAFTPARKRYFYPVVAACSLLFLGGVALAYFLVLPKGLQWLLGFGSGDFNVQNRATDYFTFVALFVLAFGVVFEMPVVLVLLARLGVVDDRFLRENRRYAIVVCAIVAAVITPTQDAFSMLAMFVPLVLLYEVSIVLARVVQPKRKTGADAEDPGGDPDGRASRAPV